MYLLSSQPHFLSFHQHQTSSFSCLKLSVINYALVAQPYSLPASRWGAALGLVYYV